RRRPGKPGHRPRQGARAHAAAGTSRRTPGRTMSESSRAPPRPRGSRRARAGGRCSASRPPARSRAARALRARGGRGSARPRSASRRAACRRSRPCAGLVRKAWSEPYSSGSNFAQSPVGERKSGIPLSVLTPAPVSTTQGCRRRMSSASSCTDIRAIVESCPTVDYHFETEVRVRFAETDAQGVAHHAVYLVWFELARIDYLARFRGGYPELRAEGIEALTTEVHVRYLAPARFDDRLTVRCACGTLRG